MTVAEMIELLKTYPQDANVYIHDEDTDWSLPVDPSGLRIGKDRYGNGVEGALMIKSVGY